MEDLKQTLRQMGVNRLYLGQRAAIRAVELVQEDEDRLLDVVNGIYKVIAAEQNKSWTAVERQLRTAVSTAWKTNPDLLQTIAGYSLLKQPTASEFIEILYNYTTIDNQQKSFNRCVTHSGFCFCFISFYRLTY